MNKCENIFCYNHRSNDILHFSNNNLHDCGMWEIDPYEFNPVKCEARIRYLEQYHYNQNKFIDNLKNTLTTLIESRFSNLLITQNVQPIKKSEESIDEKTSRNYLEKKRWPNGIICVWCESENVILLDNSNYAGRKKREGLYKCRNCRKQFTLTTRTRLQGMHVSCKNLLSAFKLIKNDKLNALQLSKKINVSYKTAYYLHKKITFIDIIEELFTTKDKKACECCKKDFIPDDKNDEHCLKCREMLKVVKSKREEFEKDKSENNSDSFYWEKEILS